MLAFIKENLSTIIIGLIILGAVVGIVIKMIKDKKNGKTACNCGCGCESCPSAGICHKK